MAFGSGSSLATDRWTRRIGFPSSAQLLKVGKASRLHRPSSSKPVAHRGSTSATLISRSRRLFFFRIAGFRGGDPSLGSLPTHPKKARQSSPDGLPGNPLLAQALLGTHPCCHLERPQASVPAELPRRAV